LELSCNNQLKEMHDLVLDAQPEDHFFFHCMSSAIPGREGASYIVPLQSQVTAGKSIARENARAVMKTKVKLQSHNVEIGFSKSFARLQLSSTAMTTA
jgi:hypothetical protein